MRNALGNALHRSDDRLTRTQLENPRQPLAVARAVGADHDRTLNAIEADGSVAEVERDEGAALAAERPGTRWRVDGLVGTVKDASVVAAIQGLVGVELTGDRVTVIGRAITVVDGVLSSAANPT